MVSEEEIRRAAQEVMGSDGRNYLIVLEGDRLEVEINPTNVDGRNGGFLCYLREEDVMYLSVEHIVALISESLGRRRGFVHKLTIDDTT